MSAPAPQRILTPRTPSTPPPLTPVYVHPGQVVVSGPAGPASFTTILGSCVAVCLHDAGAEIGGLNHFLLPVPTDDAEPTPRYAGVAMEMLLQRMLAEGARPKRIVAQVFGGASVLRAFEADVNHLGRRNVTAALEILSGHRIPVKHTDVGGTRGRKVVFGPRDGSVTVHLLGR